MPPSTREVVPSALDTETEGFLNGYETMAYTLDEPLGTHVSVGIIETSFSTQAEIRIFDPLGTRLWFGSTGAGNGFNLPPVFTIERDGPYMVAVSYASATVEAGSGTTW